MLRNVGSNWVMTLATILATSVLTPFVIHRLGHDGYGTWTLITAITGYMNLIALGVPMASVRYLAQHVAEHDVRRTNATIGTCVGLYLAIGAAALACGAVSVVWFSRVYDVPAGWSAQAHVALALMVVQVAAGFIGLLPEGIMFAHQDFVLRNLVRIGGVLLRLMLTFGLLALDASLVLLALVQILCLAADIAASLLLIRRRYPGIRVRLGDCQWAVVRRIVGFSLYVLLLSAGGRLSFETDALVIGAFLSVGAIPFYAVANSLVVYLMDFVIAIAAVVSPMTTKLKAEGRVDELEGMFLTWSKVALSISIAAGVFLIVLGPRFIGWWIEPSFEGPAGEVLQILMMSCFVFLPVRGVALPVLFGLGKPRVPACAFVAAGVLNLALSIVLARPLGLAGVALGTAIPNVLFALVVLVAACRELGVAVTTYLRYVVPRAGLGAMPLVVLLLWFKLGVQVQGLGGLAAAGLAMVLLFGAIWVLFVYRDDPFVDLRPQLVQLRSAMLVRNSRVPQP
jgi:O-antigen/teichoic acid export membrane protein